MSDTKGSTLIAVLAAALVALFAFQLWLASQLGVECFDGFENLLTAAGLAGHPLRQLAPESWFASSRAFLFPVVLAPLYAFARLFDDPSVVDFIAAHVAAVLIAAATGWAVYRLLRVHLDRASALSGAALFCFNPLVIHLTPIIKEDLAGTLFTAAALRALFLFDACPLGQPARRRHALAVGVFAACAYGMRYNLLALLPVALSLGPRPRLRSLATRILSFGLAPMALWLLAAGAVTVVAGRAHVLAALPHFLGEFWRTLRYVAPGGAQASLGWINFLSLWLAVSPPVLALAALGMAWAIRSRDRPTLFHAGWCWLVLLFHTLLLSKWEARYLLPLFPSLYFCAMTGLRELTARLKLTRSHAALLASLFALWPAVLAGRELLRHLDPFYRSSFIKELSGAAALTSTSGRIVWLGPFYPLHPESFVFHRDDPYTYIDHVFAGDVMFFGEKPVVASYAPLGPVLAGEGAVDGAFAPTERTSIVKDGDAVILNLEAGSYVTADLPGTLKPLIVERAHVLELRRAAPGAPNFRAAVEGSSARVRAKAGSANAFAVELTRREPGLFAAYATTPDGSILSLGVFEGRATPLAVDVAVPGLSSDKLATLNFVTYDHVRMFQP